MIIQFLTNDLSDSLINSDKINDGSIGSVDLASDSVTSNKIVDKTVSLSDLADNSVDSSKIVDGVITTDDIKDNSISMKDIHKYLIDKRYVNSDESIGHTGTCNSGKTNRYKLLPTGELYVCGVTKERKEYWTGWTGRSSKWGSSCGDFSQRKSRMISLGVNCAKGYYVKSMSCEWRKRSCRDGCNRDTRYRALCVPHTKYDYGWIKK